MTERSQILSMVLAGLSISCSFVAKGQDISSLLSRPNPFGIGEKAFSFLDSGRGSAIPLKGSLVGGIGINSAYNSNVYQSATNETRDVITNLAPSLAYNSDSKGDAEFSLSVNYTPVYQSYLDNSDLNRFNQSGNIAFNAKGSRTQITVYGAYVELSQADRLVGDFVNGSLFNTGVTASYQLAPRTSINGGVYYSEASYAGGTATGSTSVGSNLGALWAASENLSFGPLLTYARSESSNIGTSDSASFGLQVTYKVDEKIRIAGSLGLLASSYSRDEGAKTYNITGNLSADYKIDERWSWSNSAGFAPVPSPSQNNFVVSDFSFSSTLNRQLDYGSARLGVDFHTSTYESVGPVTSGIDSENNLSLVLGYQRQFLADRLSFDASARYSLNNGRREWNQLLISTGFQIGF
jgi:hypothetical protein